MPGMKNDGLWGGPKYRKDTLPKNDWESSVFENVDIAPGSKIIHIGADDLDMTERLMKAVGDGFVLRVEYDDNLFKTALADSRFQDKNRALLFRADPCAIPSSVPQAPFDLLFSQSAMERCPNHTRLFSRLIRLVKPGGQVYAELAGAGDCKELTQVVNKVAGSDEFSRYFKAFHYPYRLFAERELNEILFTTGYGKVKVTSGEVTREVADESFADWFSEYHGYPYLKQLPSGMRAKFVDAVKGACFDQKGVYKIRRSILTFHGYRLWGDLMGEMRPGSVSVRDDID